MTAPSSKNRPASPQARPASPPSKLLATPSLPVPPVTPPTSSPPDALFDDFGEEISRLNERLVAAIIAFSSVPGKTEVIYQPEAENIAVGFERRGDVWTFWFYPDVLDDSSSKAWSKCSVGEKAVIAALLPKLYELLLQATRERYQALRRAHQAMDEFEHAMKRLGEGA